MFGSRSDYATLRSPLSPLGDNLMNQENREPQLSSPCNDKIDAEVRSTYQSYSFEQPGIIYLFNCGSASGWQESAELNLLKAEAVLLDLMPKINNLRRRAMDEQVSNQESDKQSIFSRLSRSSNVSRKITGACSRRALKLNIVADRISIWDFLVQARSQIKQQKYFVKQAVNKEVTEREAEDWFEQVKIAHPLLSSRFIGERFLHYVERPKKNGTALLCQTKTYKNELRAQEARLLHIEKAVKVLLA